MAVGLSSSASSSSSASGSGSESMESDNDNEKKLKRGVIALDSDSDSGSESEEDEESSSDDGSDLNAEKGSSSRTSRNGGGISDSDSGSGSDSDSDSGEDSDSASEVDSEVKPNRTKRDSTRNGNGTEKGEARAKEEAKTKEKVKTKTKTKEVDAKMDVDERELEEAGGEEDSEVKVLSRKEQRRLRKKQEKQEAAVAAIAIAGTAQPTSKADTNIAIANESKANRNQKDFNFKELPTKRQNSVWVGNLSFRTTPDALRAFFENAGALREVTRVHMPSKGGAPGVEKMKGVKSVRENRGFAYVDFSMPDAKALAISLSERHLDGRRLLIKDGNDFTGRPTATDSKPTDTSTQDAPTENNPTGADQNATTDKPSSGFRTGPTKTAKKILKAQKQPPCPCLFLGNLGFEATEERIRQMFEGHARALVVMRAKKRREKEAKKGKGKGKKGNEVDNKEGEGEGEGEEEENVEVDVGIKKVRMGTFEDSGVCKGWAFVDFTSTAHATAALTNPRNHFLDGRALVVEYASPEAARREDTVR